MRNSYLAGHAEVTAFRKVEAGHPYGREWGQLQRGVCFMKLKISVLAGVVAVMVGVAAVAATLTPSAKAAPPRASVASTIAPSQSQGILDGVFNITSFTTSNGQLIANGTFTGLVNGVQQSTPAYALVDPPNICSILNLTLGPLHLDLLGLVVDLNQVHLTITAERGPGNLLGNLLCAVAGLLDNGGSGNAIQNLLDQINTIISRL